MRSTNKNLDGEMALNLNGFVDKIISFGQNNPLIALIIAVIFFLNPSQTEINSVASSPNAYFSRRLLFDHGHILISKE